MEEVKQGRLTKAEYVMGAADSLVNGLKAAMNIWSGLLLTVFLKFSPENYVTLSGYLVALEVVMIPLYYVLARITDRIKNIKRLAAIMYFPASIFPAILTLPMAYFFPGVSDTIKIVFVVSITFLQSAFGAMNSNAWRLLDIRLTADDRDRSYFHTIRNLISGAISSLGAPVNYIAVFLFKALVPYDQIQNPDAFNAHIYFYGTVLFMVIAIPVTMYYLKVRQVRIQTPPREKPENIVTIAKAMLRNKPLWLRRLSALLLAWGGLSGSAYAILVSKYYYGIRINIFSFSFVPDVPTLMLIFSCTQTISAVISIPLALWLRRKISDKSLMIATQVYLGIGGILSYLFLSDIFFTTTLMQRFYIHLASYSWGGITFGFGICGTVLDLELIDYMEWQSGQRNECTYNFIVDNIHKVTTLPITYFAAMLLVRTGFRTDDPGMITGENTRRGLVALATLVPGIFQFLSAIPLFFCDLGGEKRKRILQELAERRSGITTKKSEKEIPTIVPADFSLYM